MLRTRVATPSPDADVHTLSVVVPETAIDVLGHASNISYVAWVQDAATAHSSARGWNHAQYQREGVVFVVRRHEVDYLRPVFAADELTLQTWVSWWKAATCVRHTAIQRGDALVASATTTWALVATETGRPTRIPPALQRAFGAAM